MTKNYIEIVYDKNREAFHMALFQNNKIIRDENGDVQPMFFDEEHPELFWHNLKVFKEKVKSQ